jgi:hypothetical protein
MSMTDAPVLLPSATEMIENALRMVPEQSVIDRGVVVDILLDLRQELQQVLPN